MKNNPVRITYILILLCIISYIVMINSGNKEEFINYYGFSGENLIKHPWVIFTSIFVHSNLDHLISNLLALFFFGIVVEREVKWKDFLLIFFGGAIAGDLLSLFAYSWTTVGIGASAGIFSIIGASIIMAPFDLSMYPYIIPIPLGVLGIVYAAYNIVGLLSGKPSNISYIAHLGGLLFGLYYGFDKRGFIKGVIIIIITSVLALLGIILMSLIW